MTSGRTRGADDESADALVRLVRQATDCGVNLVQLREPAMADGALLTLVRRVLDAVDRDHTSVLVNDRTDVALASGAGGVHLRGDAVRASRVRAIAPDGFLIGRSVHSVEEAVDAQADAGVDYLVFGTVFPSFSKPKDHRTAGVAALREVCGSVRVPVIAIGGINAERAAEVAAAGAAGIAAIGMFADAVTDEGDRMRDVIRQVQQAFAR